MRVLSFSYRRRHGVPPPEADLVIDCRILEEPARPRPVMRALLAQARHYARRHPGATVAFGCEFGEERSVDTAERFARVMGVTPEHTDAH